MSRSLVLFWVGGGLAFLGLGIVPAAEPETKDAVVVEVESASETPDEETLKLIKEFEKEQAEASKSLQKQAASAPYQPDKTIALKSGEGQILGFCVLPNGELAAISGAGERYGQSLGEAVINLFGGAAKAATNRVQWLDASGAVLRSADLKFKPKAINAAADGSVVVVGEGKILRFDGEGKQTAEVESPHMQVAISDREKFAQEMMERHAEEVASSQEQVEQLIAAVKEIEAKPEDERSKQEQRQLKQTKQIVGIYEQTLKAKQAQTRDQVVEQALARMKELHRVAVSDKYVYVVANEATGYGFCVWRMTPDFNEPRKIASKLSGCCGQMDIQIAGDGVAIAENSRHRVLMIDAEGKTVTSFGKSNRADITKGFGGCCNPMNTCLDSAGCLLTSESNGLVKKYSLEGEFISIAGVAKVTEGCKNSSIGISPKGDRLYYFDVEKGCILVLAKGA